MPDDNRFAGLSDAVEDDPDEETDAEAESDESSTETGSTASTPSAGDGAPSSTDSDSTADSSVETTETEPNATAESGDDPAAFPFDATEKKTVYVRPETVADLDDARALVDAQLRTDHDVRDLTGREFYDAVFRLAAADTEALIDEILAAREDEE